jgi:hypothetical protein
VVAKTLGIERDAFVQGLYDDWDAQRRGLQREQFEAQTAAQREIDRRLDSAAADVHVLVAAALICAGYHEHRGEWRQRR